jgi:type IX secretion system PorP/SprF family membrane protein
MKKLKLIGVVLVLFGTSVFGQQDVHFSQFFASPLTLNPANAGIFNGDLRAIMNYRSQWGSISKPYNTMAASVDLPVLKKMKGGMFGIGLNFLKDDAGDSKMSTVKYAFSLAYHLDVSGGQHNHYLSVGFQAGMIQRSMSLGNLTWNDQWDGASFDQSISTVDQLGGTTVNALDVASGVHWFYSPDRDKTFFAGFSMFHINSPDVGFNAESPLIKKYTFHGGSDVNISGGTMGLLPNFVFVKQGPNQYMDVGVELKYYLQESTKFTNYKNQMYITIGPYLRWGDATYIVSRFNWNGVTASVSYDFNLSELSTVSNGNGGFEFMLGYKMDLNSNASRGHSLRFN